MVIWASSLRGFISPAPVIEGGMRIFCAIADSWKFFRAMCAIRVFYPELFLSIYRCKISSSAKYQRADFITE